MKISLTKKKKIPTHKKYALAGLYFAIPALIVWGDMMYEFMRVLVLDPLFQMVPDGGYVHVMLTLPIIALALSTYGMLKASKKDREFSLRVMIIAVILLALFALSISSVRI